MGRGAGRASAQRDARLSDGAASRRSQEETHRTRRTRTDPLFPPDTLSQSVQRSGAELSFCHGRRTACSTAVRTTRAGIRRLDHRRRRHGNTKRTQFGPKGPTPHRAAKPGRQTTYVNCLHPETSELQNRDFQTNPFGKKKSETVMLPDVTDGLPTSARRSPGRTGTSRRAGNDDTDTNTTHEGRRYTPNTCVPGSAVPGYPQIQGRPHTRLATRLYSTGRRRVNIGPVPLRGPFSVPCPTALAVTWAVWIGYTMDRSVGSLGTVVREVFGGNR